jgi:hypothetical protein
MTDDDVLSLIRSESDALFPDELRPRLIEVPVDNPILGSAISAARRVGLVCTKTDVIALAANDAKNEAFYGDIQMGIVSKELDRLKRNARSQSLSQLHKILSSKPSLAANLLDTIPDSINDRMTIMRNYYLDFAEGNTALSSMCFAEKIEVIDARAVEEFFNNQSASILRRSMGIGVDDEYNMYYRNSIQKMENLSEIHEWLLKCEKGLPTMPPVSLGTRDGHILLEIQNGMRTYHELDFIIVTNDKNLIAAANKWLHFTKNDARNITTRLPTITRISAETLYAQAWVSRLRRRPVFETPDLTDPETMEPFSMSVELFDQICFESRIKPNFQRWLVIYDEPNISRLNGMLAIDPKRKTIQVFQGGGLERRTLKGLPWFHWDSRWLCDDPHVTRTARHRAPRGLYASAADCRSISTGSDPMEWDFFPTM